MSKKLEPQADVPTEDRIDGKQLWMATDALSKAKAMRNYFQLERDKINAFWEITKREIESVKAALRNKDREKAEMTERHQVEMKVYKQKIRHILYEHKVHIANMKMEAERALKNKQEEHRLKEEEVRTDRQDIKRVHREQEYMYRDLMTRTREEESRQITEQLRDFERSMKELHLKYERKIKTLREDMETRRKEDIAAIERRKEDHIDELRSLHAQAFREIRDYYTDITSSNIETIKTLKEEVYSRKKTEAANEKTMFEIAQTNKRLTDPLTKAQKQKKSLEAELAHYERDRAALKTSKQELRQLEQRMKALLWEHEVLGQRFQKLEQDRDLNFAQYNEMLQEIQQKSVFKRAVLHKKLEVVGSLLERKEAHIAEVLKASNVADGTSAASPPPDQRGLEQIVEEKNRRIDDIQQMLAAITLRHTRITTAYDTYLRQNGVPGLA